MALTNPIFIDANSTETPPALLAPTHQFNSSFRHKQQASAYQQLLHQKANYKRQYNTPITFTKKQIENTIERRLSNDLYEEFSFKPKIEPLNPNWRVQHTINPLANKA
jgi:hypothetical protein